jgi:transcription antitermination factor NusG
MHWRAIQVQPQREFAIWKTLSGHDLPAFCPLIQVRLHRRTSPIVARPLFPGYLFVDLDGRPIRASSFAIIRRCRWVIDVLGTTPISESVMDSLRVAANASANVCVSPRWMTGHSYRLKSPQALAGLLCRLEGLDSHERARVILRLFGAERVVSVRISDLEEQ